MLTPSLPIVPSVQEIIANASPVKNLQGVYFLIKDQEVVYVGSSINVIARIAQHIAKREKSFDSYSIISLDGYDFDAVLAVEAYYVLTLQPKENAGYPPRSPMFWSIERVKNDFGVTKYQINKLIKSGELPVFAIYAGMIYFQAQKVLEVLGTPKRKAA